MPAGEPIDDRLRALLAVEQRLQQQVADARETARRRVADARAASARLLGEVDATAAVADEEEARRDRDAHERAVRALEERHQAVQAALASVSDQAVDRLARRVLARLLGANGGTP